MKNNEQHDTFFDDIPQDKLAVSRDDNIKNDDVNTNNVVVDKSYQQNKELDKSNKNIRENNQTSENQASGSNQTSESNRASENQASGSNRASENNQEKDYEQTYKQREEEKLVDTNFAKCASCGATMRFDPKTQSLICDHCGRVESFNKNQNVVEIDLVSALGVTDESWGSETKHFRCENCGAEVALAINSVARNCPFCGTTHVVETKELKGIKPSAVIPFQFGNEIAAQNSKKWARKRIFAPRSFKKSFKADNLSGVYSPSFTFDSQTKSYYKGRLGKTKTRTVGSGKNKHTQTYIDWFMVSGTIDNFFDDITIAAGNNINQKTFDKIKPFAREKGCVYEKKFLHGFMANHYSKDIKECWSEAKDIIDEELKQMIMHKHNGDHIDYLDVNTNHSEVTYKYVLVPIYVGNYTHNKKLYNLYINGSTGKVYGKAPISPLRVILAFILGIGICVGIYFMMGAPSPEEIVNEIVENTNIVNEIVENTNIVNEIVENTNIVNEIVEDTNIVNEIVEDTNIVNEIVEDTKIQNYLYIENNLLA